MSGEFGRRLFNLFKLKQLLRIHDLAISTPWPNDQKETQRTLTLTLTFEHFWNGPQDLRHSKTFQGYKVSPHLSTGSRDETCFAANWSWQGLQHSLTSSAFAKGSASSGIQSSAEKAWKGSIRLRPSQIPFPDESTWTDIRMISIESIPMLRTQVSGDCHISSSHHLIRSSPFQFAAVTAVAVSTSKDSLDYGRSWALELPGPQVPPGKAPCRWRAWWAWWS